jgi:PhoPQ-activated pathogenicity-related protein
VPSSRSGLRRAHAPRFDELMQIEDPYSYRDRLTNIFSRLPNTDHSLKGSYADAAESAFAFYQSILTNAPRPRFAWNFEDDGSIRDKTEAKPEIVKLWQAHNPTARDFRLETIGHAYSSSVLSADGEGLYVGKVPEPEQGWTDFFIELTFPSAGPHPYKFTTGVRVTPDKLPFGPPPEGEVRVAFCG